MLDLVFSNVQCVFTSLSSEAVVPAGSYHLHLVIYYQHHYISNLLYFYNLKYADYNNFILVLSLYDCRPSTFSSLDTDTTTNVFLDVLNNLVLSFVTNPCFDILVFSAETLKTKE